MPQSPLPQVPGAGARTLARRSGTRTPRHQLLSRGLHCTPRTECPGAWTTRACSTICYSQPAQQTLLEIAADPKHLGAEIGVISILHTWGQNLLLHPHIHCVIPAGGLSPDHRRWVRPRYPFFLPVKVLSRVFRGKFLAGLNASTAARSYSVPARPLLWPIRQQFAKLLRRLHRHDWVVYAKPAFGGPMQVLRYLGRYTHRVAISNHRLLAFDQERVTFRWKDYAHGGKQGQMTLAATEFLRRFFLHVLPKGFVRIRHFGFLANRFRASRLALARQLLAPSSSSPGEATTAQASIREPSSLALPTLRRIHDRDSEIYRCGTIQHAPTSILPRRVPHARPADVLRHADTSVCSTPNATPRSRTLHAHTFGSTLPQPTHRDSNPISPVLYPQPVATDQTAVQIP